MGLQRYTLGVPRESAKMALEEWLDKGMPCDLRVRRAKTFGYVAMQAELDSRRVCDAVGAQWLSWVCKWCGDVKVNIQELEARL